MKDAGLAAFFFMLSIVFAGTDYSITLCSELLYIYISRGLSVYYREGGCETLYVPSSQQLKFSLCVCVYRKMN